MSSKLNIAVIGCGYWGPNLIRNLSTLNEDCNMVKICDKETDRLQHMKRLYPQVEVTTETDQIFHDDTIDAVVIATPVSTHYNLARASLRSGKHTFIEKPMAASLAECEELIELAQANSLTLMVGHTFIYSAPVRHMKHLVRSGELGEIYYINSRRLNLGLFQRDINVAWDLATHDISIILYLLEKMPVSVNCQGKNHLNGQEDVSNISLNFADGSFATIQSSWLDPNKVREMIVVGSKRMIVYDDTQSNDKIKIFDKHVERPPHYDTFAEFQFSYHYGGMNAPFIQQAEPLRVEAKHFIDCINNGATSESSGLEGLKVVQILEATSQSLRRDGGKVEINASSMPTPSSKTDKSHPAQV